MVEPANLGVVVSETKKMVNPRVEIDTSPPFESVKEAVDRFGGSGPWVPHHLLRLAAAHHESEVFDMEKMEEQAVQLERDLNMKEQQTINILKQLEAAKRFVEDLKINMMPEFSSLLSSPYSKLENSIEGLRSCPDLSPGLMFMELTRAKSNLSKTSIDLAVIQASIDSLNKKTRKNKAFLENTKNQVPTPERVLHVEENYQRKLAVANNLDYSMAILNDFKGVNFEAAQFKKITEASRYEVMKAMAEIERTKNSIKMAEMRLNAAKKMEEAAKAVEAIAIAERTALLNGENSSNSFTHKSGGITLSFEEYKALTQRAQQADDTKFIDTNGGNPTNEPVMETFEQPTGENKFKFRNSDKKRHVFNSKEKSSSGFWSKTSIRDALSTKVIVQDDVVMGSHVEDCSERGHVSLSQMLREQSRVIFHPTKETTDDGNVEKGFFMQRKKFGFIQLPIPTTKYSKKKA